MRVVRLRILIPTVVIMYVVLGGYVIPHVDVRIAHVVLACAAALSAFTSWYFFYKYDTTPDKAQGYHSIVFTVTMVLTVALVVAATAHIVGAISSSQWEWLYIFEGAAVGVTAVVWAAKANG